MNFKRFSLVLSTAILIGVSHVFSQVDATVIEQLREAAEASGYEGYRHPSQYQDAPSTTQTGQANNALEDDGRYPIGWDTVRPLVFAEVRVFGQELFTNLNLNFNPNFNLPTPKNYILGAGDEILIEVYGSSEMRRETAISPEGTVTLPGVGPIVLDGYTIEAAENKIQNQLSYIIGSIGSDTQVRVTLSKIRSIKVNIIGEVQTPGTYTLPSFSTLFNALYMAGGITDMGSLRDIRVFRNSKLTARLDVYDFLINGRSDENIRLEDNDMILISPYETHVSISGMVKRPMIYELKKGESLETLIRYAGGFSSDAYRENINVTRKSDRQYHLYTVENPDFKTFLMQDGDDVKVDEIIDLFANRVSIDGAVWRPGEYQYSEEMHTLSQLIAMAENLKGNQFASRGLITRLRKDLTTEIIPFDIGDIVNGVNDIELFPEDQVHIPTIGSMTENYTVSIHGEINNPQTVAYRHNMTVEDLIILAGGLKESASMAKMEIARRIKDPDATGYNQYIAQTFTFPISKDLTISADDKRFILLPFDEVFIRKSPVYHQQQTAWVSGEVVFEGNYVFSRSGERLSEIIEKAGGLTPEAYIKGSSLIRRMTSDERRKVEAKLQIQGANLGNDSIGYIPIADTYPVGIDLEKALLNPGSNDDIVLREGDRVFIPKFDNTVKINGAVLSPNTVTYDGEKIKTYISQAGGYMDNARKRPYVLYMNGKIAATRTGFLHKKYPRVEPGAEIIVPEKIEREKRLSLPEIMSLSTSTTAIAVAVSNMIKN